MQNETRHQKNQNMAYFRFALIAPVIQGTFTDPSVAAYCRRVTENPIARPDGALVQYQPATLEKWVALYKEGGMEGLMPKERSDRGSVRKLTDECIGEIYRIKEKYPKLNSIQIHMRLIQDGFIPATVSPRTIQRFIKTNDLKNPPASGPLKDRKAFEEEYFGEMWMADTCYFPYIPDVDGRRRRTYLIAIVDDHSRLCVGAMLFFEDNAYNFQKVFKNAVGAHGVPLKLYADHGASYENAQNKYICGSIGTQLIHAPVRDGAARGKVERFFGVLKSRWLNGLDISQIRSLDEFNHGLAGAVRSHNLTVNSSTGQTPMDRYLNTRGRIRIAKSEEWLRDCFMNRVNRKVKNDATLSILKTQFDAPMQFIQQNVEVRFLPDRLHEAYILDKGVQHPLKLTDKQANSKAKRQNGPTIDYSRAGEGHV